MSTAATLPSRMARSRTPLILFLTSMRLPPFNSRSYLGWAKRTFAHNRKIGKRIVAAIILTQQCPNRFQSAPGQDLIPDLSGPQSFKLMRSDAEVKGVTGCKLETGVSCFPSGEACV